MNLAEKISTLNSGFALLLPEYLLVGAMLALLLVEFLVKKEKEKILFFTSVGFFLLTIFSTFFSGEGTAFLGMIEANNWTKNIRFISLFAGIIASLFAYNYSAKKYGGEWYISLFAMILGTTLASMSRHFLMVYLSIELISLPSYALTALQKENRDRAEAAIKYVLFGAFCSATFIYGVSWLYGMTGTLYFQSPDFATNLVKVDAGSRLIIQGLMLTGILFKIGAIPLHFWIPDVYETVDYPTVSIFSVLPKLAGFSVLLYWFQVIPPDANWELLLMIIALVSMTGANLAAWGQTHIQRLLAWSAIAHAGFLLAAVLPNSELSQKTLGFYLLIYTVGSLLAFGLCGQISEKLGSPYFKDWIGKGKMAAEPMILLSITMVSLTGLPPTAGFIAKWYVVLALMETESTAMYLLALGVALNTVFALFYYLRVPAWMVFRAAEQPSNSWKIGGRLSLWLLAIPLLIFGVYGFGLLIEAFK